MYLYLVQIHWRIREGEGTTPPPPPPQHMGNDLIIHAFVVCYAL